MKNKEKQIMEFNIKRLWFLVKRDFIINIKTDIFALSVMGFVSGFFLVKDRSNFDFFIFLFLLLLGFFIFGEYHKKTTKTNILILPVSNLERFLSVFLRAFVYFPIMLLVFMTLGSLIVGTMYYAIGLPFTFTLIPQIFIGLIKFCGEAILHTHFIFTAFFFGSIFYKKYAGLKFSLLLMSLTMFIFVLFIIVKLLFFNNQPLANVNITTDINFITEKIIGIGVSIFLLWLSYLRITEEQV